MRYNLNIPAKKSKSTHKWLAKAAWQGTALRFEVEAPTVFLAQAKAERQIKKSMGYMTCMSVEILKQIS